MNGVAFVASFIALYVGHMIGDHVVQTDHQAAHKAGKGRIARWAMTGHVGGYTAVQAVALLPVLSTGITAAGLTAALIVSAGTHAFIDRRWPVQWILRRTGAVDFAALASHGINGAYLTDQSLHIGALFLAALTVGWLS